MWQQKPNFVCLAFLLLPTGDLSEDPRFPKVQWPTPDVCPACHDEVKGLHTWNKAQVLQFLKQHYGTANILYTSTDSQAGPEEQIPQAERETSSLKKQEDKFLGPEKQLDPKRRAKDLPKGDEGQRASVEEEMKKAVSFLGIGFSNLDMSLCIVLYVASSLFLMIMYFFFRMRSKRWKTRHPRPYV